MIAVVIAVATGLRLLWVLLVPTRPVGDFAMYLESAAHLVAHGALDPEFVYMPGYVMLLAAVEALGGGLLAVKLVTVALAGGAAGALYGLTARLWDRRAALLAGLLYAVWPAGIAVCSVTGTDMPTAALVVIAAFCLVRFGQTRPLLAAVLFGAVMGAAAWIRAVALPLSALGLFAVRAQGASWRKALERTGVACVTAAVVLAPWALRNRARYGELFFTDSHGGLTALVGANPNSEGRYSRSLNRMFQEVTGYRLLAEPHRAADRAAYALAREWSAFEPLYTVGLVAAKAERLLANERPLLYWPLFRAGALAPPQSLWFAARWRQLEALVDGFWIVLVVSALFGLGVAAAERRWLALVFVPGQLALVGIYALFFAEVRYQLPIVILLFPAAGGALAWLPRARLREAAIGGGVLLVVLAAWSLFLLAGARLRARHGWAVHVCRIEGEARFCSWRAAGGAAPRGVWNGVGVASAAETRVALPAGSYRVRAVLEGDTPARVGEGSPLPPIGQGLARLSSAGGAPFTAAVGAKPVHAELLVEHPGGELVLRLGTEGARVWLGELRIEAR